MISLFQRTWRGPTVPKSATAGGPVEAVAMCTLACTHVDDQELATKGMTQKGEDVAETEEGARVVDADQG
jgi:hypothetical protein